jgi:proton-translocating NADH-quinone oxidoreductase chain L
VSEPTDLALVALGLPLLAAVLAAVMGTGRLGKFAHVPAVVAFGSAAGLALWVLTTGAGADSPTFVLKPVTWFAAGSLNATFTIHVDPLACVMLATVTFVATWIAVFSAGYMHDDPGYARYFAVMSLFVFAMCLLVLANNFFLLLAGWEGVGVCSYLLVGYYYAKPSAANAARKAFLVTRLGDVGFLLGIFLLWQVGGYNTDLDKLFAYIAKNPPAPATMTAACLLLFCGAVGKSAQIPLYVWLPDAMEGPTPVSALIHAATMVTAGVYLLARCAPLFVLSPDAQQVVCLVGGLTALLSAFIALAQTDLKRVLAYSTVSQIGYMFMALGTGGAKDADGHLVVVPGLAVAAAVFHLFTHAFFKALLFLASGSVMHAMGGVIDMRRFGGLRKLMPVTHLTFLCGAAALAAVPLTSGFWSKDQILDVLHHGSEHGGPNAFTYGFVLVVALVTAFLTAFYTFRAYFLTFWGEERVPSEAGHHAHESPWVMLGPLCVLAVGALFAGAAVEQFGHQFSRFLGQTPSVQLANRLADAKPGDVTDPHFDPMLGGIGIAVALSGIGLAWAVYRKGGPEEVPSTLRGAYRLSQNKLYVDEVYGGLFVKPAELLAAGGRQLDSALDGIARGVAHLPKLAGSVLRPLQNGLIQSYSLGMVLGLAVLVILVVFRSPTR